MRRETSLFNASFRRVHGLSHFTVPFQLCVWSGMNPPSPSVRLHTKKAGACLGLLLSRSSPLQRPVCNNTISFILYEPAPIRIHKTHNGSSSTTPALTHSSLCTSCRTTIYHPPCLHQTPHKLRAALAVRSRRAPRERARLYPPRDSRRTCGKDRPRQCLPQRHVAEIRRSWLPRHNCERRVRRSGNGIPSTLRCYGGAVASKWEYRAELCGAQPALCESADAEWE